MSLNETKYKFYQEAGTSGYSLNQLEYNWLGDEGATGFTLPERWKSFLSLKGFSSGATQDKFLNYLDSLGLSGSLLDKSYKYYKNPIFWQDFDLSYGSTMANAAIQGPTLSFTRGSNSTQRYTSGDLIWAPHNLILQSEDTSITWTNIRSTDSSDVVAGPFSDTLADAIAEDSTAASTHYIQQNITLVSGAQYVYSGYFKAAARGWVGLAYNESGNQRTAYLDLSDGSVGNYAGWGAAPIVESLGNGFYRFSIKTKAIVTTGNYIRIFAAEGDLDLVYDGLSQDSIYVYGAQINRDTLQPYNTTTTTAYYGPRFDHDSSGNKLGLLIEGSRTNLLTYSDQFDHADWTKTNITVVANDVVSPDGTTTADKLTDTSTGGRDTQVIVVASGATITVSRYIKPGTATIFRLQVHDNVGSADGFRTWFDLSAGTIGTEATFGTAVNGGATIKDVGSGWYRISMTGSISGKTDYMVWCSTSTADASTLTLDTGTRWCWGAQMEVGSFPTSYIPTLGAAAIRATEICNTTDVSWLTQGKGTIVVEGTYPDTLSNNQDILIELFASSSVRISLGRYIGGGGVDEMAFYVQNSGDQAFIRQAGVAVAGASFKVAIAYNTNDFAMSVDGGTVLTDTSGSVPIGITKVTIGGRDSGTNYANCHIKSIKYWNVRKINSFLQSVST